MKANSYTSKLQAEKAAATRSTTFEENSQAAMETTALSAFEMLLVDISTRFIALPADRVDNEILLAQQQVCECLGIDISALWQTLSDPPGALVATHIYVPPDFSVPVVKMDARDTFPWSMERLFKGKIIIISRLAELPAAAARDLELYRYYTIKSAVTFPLSAGGRAVFGAVSFNEFRKERNWTMELVEKLRLVAQIFANALARKQADQTLTKSQRLLAETEKIGKVGGWEIDLETMKLTWTPEIYSIYEVDLAFEPTLEKSIQFCTPAYRQITERLVNRAIKHGESYDVELEIITAKGHPRTVHGIGRVDAEHRMFFGFIQDITAQKHNEREMAQLRLELSHLSRVLTLNEISGSLAHEINQPLAAILNNAEAAKILLSQEKDKQEDIPAIVEDIILDARRASDVIRKLRKLVTKGNEPFEPLPINALIEDVLSLLQSSLTMNKITLRLDLKPDLPNISGDRVRLQQVLLNLVTNAMDALKEAPLRILTVRSAMDNSGMITVSVSDSGPGITKTGREKVFQPFFTTKKDGLGLGLSICRSIIKEHGGRIWEEDNPVGGVTFSFSLKTQSAQLPSSNLSSLD